MSGPLLELHEVTCTIGGVRAVDGVDLAVDEGQIVGIAGPNGAGKTSLFNAITGFIPYQVGDVRWAGRSVRGWKPHRIANSGLMRTFQNAGGFAEMTVRQNLAVSARRWDGPGIEEIADALMLAEHMDRKVGDCSLATRKLVGLAIAAVRRPRLLLLDEPLAGLDDLERDAAVNTIRLVHRGGVTVLLIEHDVDRMLALVDRLVILDLGAKVAEGTPAELADDPALRDVYLKA